MPRPEIPADHRTAKDHFDRAVDFERSGKFDDAVDELRHAAKLEPSSGDIHINLAALLRKPGLEESSQ